VTWSLELEQIIQWAKKKMQYEKQEIAVRENNPALNDAWETYQTLYKLIR